MSETIIKVENLSKQYRLGEIGTGSLSHDLNRWWHAVRGKENPYLKIGETNERTQKGNSDYVWALKDINFEIKRGEVYGVIGKNGAGKSTLLKLLSRITSPTTGEIKVNGKMASLLEVGTGFHGELTGRENVFLNGAILGMKRKEIRSKMDEIIAFAGIEKYIDTPVKRYSSGMYVRLAFAVAAHLETDILILDEVLAIGDASFQRKCFGKMNDAVTNQGKTVLLVSHNLSQVQALCKKGILLEHGQLKLIDDITKVINRYVFDAQSTGTINTKEMLRTGPKSYDYHLNKLEFDNDITNIYEDDHISFKIEVECFTSLLKELAIEFNITDNTGNVLIRCFSTASYKELNLEKGIHTFQIKLRPNLKANVYTINMGARSLNGVLEYVPSITTIEIRPKENGFEEWNNPSSGLIRTVSHWEHT